METTDYKSADKKRYAISTKAYNDFVDRIRDSLEDMSVSYTHLTLPTNSLV